MDDRGCMLRDNRCMMHAGGWVMDAGGWVMEAGGWVMDAGGRVMDAGTRPISRVGRREVRCGSARCLVVARQDLCGGKERGNHKGGAAAEGRRPLFVEAAEGRLPCSLPLATTNILFCHSALVVSLHKRSAV